MTVAGANGDAAYGKRRRLAAELRLLRDLGGVTGRELAARIGISQSKVSRIEAGATLPSVGEVTKWARAVSAPEEVQRLLEILTEAARNETETWQAAMEGRPQVQDEIREREAAARRSYTFEPAVVPGLLQTPAYAQRLFTIVKTTLPQISVASAVAGRMDRQLTLYEEGKEFGFIMTEGALRWRPGPPRMLMAQYDRIAAVSTLDNVSIGIIPFGAEVSTVFTHGFALYEGEDADTAPFVLVDTHHAWLTVNAGDDVAIYRSHWSALRKDAVYGDEARDLLGRLSAELRTGAERSR